MQRRKEKLARKAARFASDALDVGDGNLGIVGEGDKSKEEKAKKWRGGATAITTITWDGLRPYQVIHLIRVTAPLVLGGNS